MGNLSTKFIKSANDENNEIGYIKCINCQAQFPSDTSHHTVII